MKTHKNDDIVTVYKFSLDNGQNLPKRFFTIDKSEASIKLLEVLDSPENTFEYIAFVKEKMSFYNFKRLLQENV